MVPVRGAEQPRHGEPEKGRHCADEGTDQRVGQPAHGEFSRNVRAAVAGRRHQRQPTPLVTLTRSPQPFGIIRGELARVAQHDQGDCSKYQHKGQRAGAGQALAQKQDRKNTGKDRDQPADEAGFDGACQFNRAK